MTRRPHPIPFFSDRILFALLAGLTATTAGAQTPAPAPSSAPAVAAPRRPVPAPTPAPTFAPYRITRTLAPGVELIQELVPKNVPGGPLVVTVLRVSTKTKGVRLKSALGYDRVWENNATQGRERVSTLAARNKALAAVNTSFFTYQSGHPIGLFLSDGSLVTEPSSQRTVFGITRDGKPVVTAYGYEGRVEAEEGAPLKLNGLNRRPGKGGTELLLFTPTFYSATLPVPGRVEVILSGVGERIVPGKEIRGRVEQLGENGRTPLQPGTVVLSGSGAAADWLRASAQPGKSLRIRIETPPLPGAPKIPATDLVEGAAGGPRLLTGGRITVQTREEGFPASFANSRHPRTAVGVTAKGEVLLLTVDGRQPLLSRGATLAETAALLLKFGAVDGVNMDGGGSTALALNGGVGNAPSDNGSERPVAGVLLVFADTKTAARSIPAPSPTPGVANLPWIVGDTRMLTPNGAAAAPSLPPGAVWTSVGGVGFVAQDGRFFALRAGRGEVRLLQPDGRVLLSLPLTVTGPPTNLLPPEDPGAPQGGPSPAAPPAGTQTKNNTY